MTTTVKLTKKVHSIRSAVRWSEESIREGVPRRVGTKDDGGEHSTLLEGTVDKANKRSRQQKSVMQEHNDLLEFTRQWGPGETIHGTTGELQ